MKKIGFNRREIIAKLLAIAIAIMIVTSTATTMSVIIETRTRDVNHSSPVEQIHRTHPCEVGSVLTQDGEWIYFDSTAAGTPAEVHVTVSDTSGITIVADFHGFWKRNKTINGLDYDILEMPGANSRKISGAPMLPCMFEYLEIPHDVDITIDILSSSSALLPNYNVSPAPPQAIPFAIGAAPDNETELSVSEITFGPVYSSDDFYPGELTSLEGDLNTTSTIMRGHRLLGVSIFPVQFSPDNMTLRVYSQIVLKLQYSFPAQILPLPDRLRSEPFEKFMIDAILNYDSVEVLFAPEVGVAKDLKFHFYVEGAEYLIITTEEFKHQADRLAEWKELKGLRSKVLTVTPGSRQSVTSLLEFIYYRWSPVPTYVLLMGDVEDIPANYDVDHEAIGLGGIIYPDISAEDGNIASDLGYFNIEGNGYFPEMIYSRISVDTELQAEIIVNKTLEYEKSPPSNTAFYRNFLSAGFFQDSDITDTRDGVEDESYPLIYTLEEIRHYLNHTRGYNAHINYSCAGWSYDSVNNPGHVKPFEELEFRSRLYDSYFIKDSFDRYGYFEDYEWLWGYDWSETRGIYYYFDFERSNITANFNDGRFLMFYYGHGGSKNMVHPLSVLPHQYFPGQRDFIEGWQHPFLNTSYFADLTNGNMTPLVISIACRTGWFDGETDEDYLSRIIDTENAFAEYGGECFAENITRLEGGGAIAAISSSRDNYAEISQFLLYGLIRAFWPGFQASLNQPIYEMGGALLSSKLYSIRQWSSNDENIRRVTMEEFHLFGDPETQLWTDVPSLLTVTYPNQIGIGTQRFVVTVTDDEVPVSHAKVCLQKGSDIYQVGYTDPLGQVIFNVHPSSPGMMNLTVTKHNYVPYLGEMECICSAATLTPRPEEGPAESSVNLEIHGFYDTEDVLVYNESVYIATIPAGDVVLNVARPKGRTGFTNIIAIGSDSGLVAIGLYRCYSENPRPDPYIHSQWDEGEDVGWYNPDIALFNGVVPVTLAGGVYPTITYAVQITVHNQGDASAVDTTVSLEYAQIGAGVSWDYAGEYTIETIPIGESRPAIIYWAPPSEGAFCLKATISSENDLNLDNNVGVLAVDVMEYSSPAVANFMVGNPTESDDYVFIKVRQTGSHSNVWNASIVGYSSQIINSTQNEAISILVDPGPDSGGNESRLFTVDVYVNYELVGGISFKVTREQAAPPGPGIDPVIIATILGVFIGVIGTFAVVVLFRVKKKR